MSLEHSRQLPERPPHITEVKANTLYTALSVKEGKEIVSTVAQQSLFPDEDAQTSVVKVRGYEREIPKTIEEFAIQSGREKILRTKTFRFIPGQIAALLELDASEQNAVVAASTGAGKSYVALALAAKYLQEEDHSKVLYITRQKPLVEQVMRDAQHSLTLAAGDMAALTGATPASKRKTIYASNARLLFATPQTIQNDLGIGRGKNAPILDLSSVSLVIVDEVHKSRGRDAAACILEHVKNEEINTRVVGFSATPYMNENEQRELLTKLSRKTDLDIGKKEFRDVERILLDVGVGTKHYIKHDVTLTLPIRAPAKTLEQGITDCHQKIVRALSGFPDLAQEAEQLMSWNEDRTVRVKGEHETSHFARVLRNAIENDKKKLPWRDNLIDHVYVLGALGRYHHYLTQTGRFFFLDRVGREFAEAQLVHVESSTGKIVPAMFGAGRDGQNWFYRMLSINPDLGIYKRHLEAAYRDVAKGTEYEHILNRDEVRNIFDLTKKISGLDSKGFEKAYFDNGSMQKGVTAGSMIKEMFQQLQTNLAQSKTFYDHPLTEKAISILEAHLRYRRPGNVLLHSKYFSDAVFLAEHAEHRLKRYGIRSHAVAGGKYMNHRECRELLENFGAGEVDFMVGTSFLTEGHHIPGANTLVMKHQPSRGDELQQFMGRVGREWKGFIHGLVLPASRGVFFANQQKMKRANQFIQSDFRRIIPRKDVIES